MHISIAGEPADVVQIAGDYSQWMTENDIPKLFVNAEPGAILIGAVRDFCRTWKNQTEVTVPGSHFIQEDSAPAIGQAIAAWMNAHGTSDRRFESRGADLSTVGKGQAAMAVRLG